MDDGTVDILQNPTNEDTDSHPWYRLWWLLGFLVISLLIGIAGYYYLAKLAFVDSLLNASMILGGMGPVNTLSTNSAKIFASFYALYSGMVFLVIVAFIIDSVVN